MKSKYKELISHSILYAVGNGLKKVFMFLLIPIYTYTLSTYEYGVSEIFTSALELAFPILTLSISDATFRFLLDLDSDRAKILTNSIFIVVLGIIILVLVSPIFIIKFGTVYSIMFLLLYISHSLLFVIAQYSRGINEVKLFAISSVTNSILLLTFTTFFLLVFKIGVNGFIIPIILSNFITIVILVCKLNILKIINLRYFDLTLIRNMLHYSIYIVPNVIAWWGLNLANKYILIAYYGVAVSGVFAVASKLPSLINLFTSIFQQAWQYSSTNSYSDANHPEFYKNVFKYYTVIIASFGTILLFVLPWVSKLFLFGDFYQGWVYSAPLILAALIGSIAYFFGTFYQVVKQNKMGMISTIVGALVGLIVSFITVRYFGPLGVAYSTVLGYLVIAIFRVKNTKRFVCLNIRWTPIVTVFFLMFIQTLLWQFGINQITVFLQLVIILIIYLLNIKALIYILGHTKMFIKNFVGRFLNRNR